VEVSQKLEIAYEMDFWSHKFLCGFKIFPFHQCFFMVGIIPVFYTPTFKIGGGFSVSAESSIAVSFSTGFTTKALLGVRSDQLYGVTPFSEFKFTPSYTEPKLEVVCAHFNVDVYVKPTIELEFYNLLQADFDLSLHGDYDKIFPAPQEFKERETGCKQCPTATQLFSAGSVSLQGELMFTLDIIKKFPITMELFDFPFAVFGASCTDAQMLCNCPGYMCNYTDNAYSCVVSPRGTKSLQDCLISCPNYNCNSNYQCVATLSGNYNDRSSCTSNCFPKWSCAKTGCYQTQYGYNTQAECENNCQYCPCNTPDAKYCCNCPQYKGICTSGCALFCPYPQFTACCMPFEENIGN